MSGCLLERSKSGGTPKNSGFFLNCIAQREKWSLCWSKMRMTFCTWQTKSFPLSEESDARRLGTIPPIFTGPYLSISLILDLFANGDPGRLVALKTKSFQLIDDAALFKPGMWKPSNYFEQVTEIPIVDEKKLQNLLRNSVQRDWSHQMSSYLVLNMLGHGRREICCDFKFGSTHSIHSRLAVWIERLKLCWGSAIQLGSQGQEVWNLWRLGM